jgi:hypothetical protein
MDLVFVVFGRENSHGIHRSHFLEYGTGRLVDVKNAGNAVSRMSYSRLWVEPGSSALDYENPFRCF